MSDSATTAYAVGYYNHIGGRELNEDDFFHLSLVVSGKQVHLAGVADGMGGNDAGEAASQAAVQACQSFLANALVAKGKALAPEFLAECARAAMRKANAAVLALDKGGSPGCTLTFGIFTDRHVVLCHAGDSRAYLCDGSGVRQLTEDHADGNGALTNRLGRWPEMDCDVLTHDVQADAVYLFCSDGVYGNIGPSGIAGAFSSTPDVKQGCVKLVETARNNGGPRVDNLTALALESGRLNRQAQPAASASTGTRVKRVARASAQPASAMPDMPQPVATPRKSARDKRFMWVAGTVIALLLLLIGLAATMLTSSSTDGHAEQATQSQDMSAPGATAQAGAGADSLQHGAASPRADGAVAAAGGETNPTVSAQDSEGSAGGVFGSKTMLMIVALIALLAAGCIVYLLLPTRN